MKTVVEKHAEGLLAEFEIELEIYERAQFTALCAQANGDFLTSALKELRGVARSVAKAKARAEAAGTKCEAAALIPKIIRTYYRKLGEQSKLFPALSLFEAAYRTHLSAWMEHHYGTPQWWGDIYAHIKRGGKSSDFSDINGVSVTAGTPRVIENMLRGIDGQGLHGTLIPTLSDGRKMLERSKLSDIEELIREQWVQFKTSIPDRLHHGAPLDLEVFMGMFRRVRDARNLCSHHREVKDRAGILSNIEQLVDLVNVHLEMALAAVHTAAVRPYPFQVLAVEKHSIGLPERQVFETVFTIDTVVRTSDLKAFSLGEALIMALEPLSADDRLKLTSISVRAK